MKKYIWLKRLSIVISSCIILGSQQSDAQVSGIKKIPGDYETIGAAISNIFSVGLNGHVYLELQQTYDGELETYPITIPENLSTTINKTITIRPALNATGIVIKPADFYKNDNVPLFAIYGSYIKIDGRPGGIGTNRALRIESSSVSGSAIQFTNNASNNIVTYSHLTGRNELVNASPNNLESGIVVFNPKGPFPVGVAGNGPHNNEISNCLFDGIPYNNIYAYGHPDAPNVANKILNNEIINFRGHGIKVMEDGPGSSWTISGNHFYDKSFRRGETGNDEVAIWFNPGILSGINLIENNIVGGIIQVIDIEAKSRLIQGIFINAGKDALTLVRNNVFKSMSFISDLEDVNFKAILVEGDSYVDCTGNQIGGGSSDDAIEMDSEGGRASFKGISYNGCGRVKGSISQNSIRNIKVKSVTQSIFTGIEAPSPVNINGNQVQQAEITSTGNVTITAIQATTESICPSSSTQLLHNNLFTNIFGSSAFGDAFLTGIKVNGKIAINTGNIIGSETDPNSIKLIGQTAIITGILIEGTPEDVSINEDIIGNLSAVGSSSSIVKGIAFNGKGNVKISGNNIFHLEAAETEGLSIMTGEGSSDVTLEKNTITGLNSVKSIGVKVDAVSDVKLTAMDNEITNWEKGMLVDGDAGVLDLSVVNNVFTGNETAFENETSATLNATCNWWGAASGPGGAGPGTGDIVGPDVVFEPWATIPEYISVNAGDDQTIYIGFGPTSKMIIANVVSCGEVSYEWSTGETAPFITVNPSVTTAYSITVKDAFGHEATDQVTIIVVDVSCGKRNEKISLCHVINANRRINLCVSPEEAAMHIAHGDVLGDCNSTKRNQVSNAIAINEEEIEKITKMVLYPNPANEMLNVQWVAAVNGNQSIQVMDIKGRVVLNQHIAQHKGTNSTQINISRLSQGAYILRMKVDDQIQALKFFIEK